MRAARPDQLTDAIHRFGLARDQLTAALVRTLGIGDSDLTALEHLEADGPLTQRELGRRLLLTSGGVTVLVDRLERTGWVTRRPNPTDRRSTLLELTPKATDASPEPLTAYHAALASAAQRLDQHTRTELVHLMQTLTAEAINAADKLRVSTTGPRGR